MGYDLLASRRRGKKEYWYHLSAFTFPRILRACGDLFQSRHDTPHWQMPVRSGDEGDWYCPYFFKPDKRYDGKDYPPILDNDGFRVTAYEAKVMARCARNYVANEHSSGTLEAEHIIDNILGFADWAEKSGGFKIH